MRGRLLITLFSSGTVFCRVHKETTNMHACMQWQGQIFSSLYCRFRGTRTHVGPIYFQRAQRRECSLSLFLFASWTAYLMYDIALVGVFLFFNLYSYFSSPILYAFSQRLEWSIKCYMEGKKYFIYPSDLSRKRAMIPRTCSTYVRTYLEYL